MLKDINQIFIFGFFLAGAYLLKKLKILLLPKVCLLMDTSLNKFVIFDIFMSW